MTENNEAKPSTLAPGEKITPVMVYTANSLIRGSVISKENFRVSIWLRTAGVPDYMHFKNANVLVFGPSLQSQTFQDYFLPTPQVAAFHLVPPASDPLDYDETEANRKMEPVTVLLGSFRFNGQVRMSAQTDLANHLSISRSPFMSLYNVEITNPNLQAMGVLRIPFILVRMSMVTYGVRA